MMPKEDGTTIATARKVARRPDTARNSALGAPEKRPRRGTTTRLALSSRGDSAAAEIRALSGRRGRKKTGAAGLKRRWGGRFGRHGNALLRQGKGDETKLGRFEEIQKDMSLAFVYTMRVGNERE